MKVKVEVEKGKMMAYWWVSQGATYNKEASGGYLWAPFKSQSGKKIYHWESMKDVRLGDIVFSYVDQEIIAVSKVVSNCYKAVKPFSEGTNWQGEGNKLDLEYYPLKKPLKVYTIIDDLQAILEKQTKHKPLNKRGQGNQGYLYPLIEEAGDFLLKKIADNLDLHVLKENIAHQEKEQKVDIKEPSSKEKPAQEQAQKEKHLSFKENQVGISFDSILGPYLKGAGKIIITDPYIRIFYQICNLIEFIETIVKNKQNADEIYLHLVTTKDPYKYTQQQESFESIKESWSSAGIFFTYEFVDNNKIHARHIVTDHGWKILLDRGLDIFKQYEMRDRLKLPNRMQKFRSCKPFEVTFLKKDGTN